MALAKELRRNVEKYTYSEIVKLRDQKENILM
jgi:hypothetical protein